MSESNSIILENWAELKALIDAAEVDVLKNANGNSAAGVRARRALRLLKGRSADLVKLTISEEKSRKS
jgi:hypothetical protein|tara:strand:+ start:14738 stop:14941 length:204 start_codon:yes stop_codon:yes gene_type:complete